MMALRNLLATAVCCIAGPVTAAEMLDVEVDYEDGLYMMTSSVWFDAPLENVYEIFRRWDYSAEFSSAIVEARDVEADELGRPQYYVRNRGCVLFFCRSFERRGHAELEPNSWLIARADPDTSDFKRSDERWDFVAQDGGTVVKYDLKMTPDFWIPPGIGPYMIMRKLKNDGGDAIDRIEVLAQNLDQSVAQQ